MTKTAAINALIVSEYKRNGGDIARAFDAVLGAGSYAKLASDVYDALRAKSAN